MDLSCVFLFEDSSGVHNGCRELVGWENEGIEDTDYKGNICYSKLSLNFILVYFATPTLIKADWRRLITGVGVVKVVPWNMSTPTPPGELTIL